MVEMEAYEVMGWVMLRGRNNNKLCEIRVGCGIIIMNTFAFDSISFIYLFVVLRE